MIGIDSGLGSSPASSALAAATTHSPFQNLTAHLSPAPEYAIIGAGVAGLTIAALFERAGVPYVVLEKRPAGQHLAGADVALYPAAVEILHELGLPEAFWTTHSTPIHTVHVCRPNRESQTTEPLKEQPRCPVASNDLLSSASGNASVHSWPSTSTETRAIRTNRLDPESAPPSIACSRTSTEAESMLSPAQRMISTMTSPTPIKSISLDKVLGSGQCMRITNRRSLTTHLQRLVPQEKIIFNAQVLDLVESSQGHVEILFMYQSAFASTRVAVVIGADGVKSACRARVQHETPKPPRYAGEICYRGSFPFARDESDPVKRVLLRQIEDLFIKEDYHRPNSMTLVYSSSRRTSWGFLNEAGTAAYWWSREPWSGTREEFAELQHKRRDMPSWPEPLRSMYQLTSSADFYLQPIVDREADREPSAWCGQRVVLLGDAAHPATPELFQGANLAIEDAHLLARMLLATAAAAGEPQRAPLCPEPVLLAFAKQRHRHVSKIQRMSFNQTKFFTQAHSKGSKILRNVALKLTPTSYLERKLKRTAVWNPKGAVVQGVAEGLDAVAKAVGHLPATYRQQDPSFVTEEEFGRDDNNANSTTADMPALEESPSTSWCSSAHNSDVDELEHAFKSLKATRCRSILSTISVGSPSFQDGASVSNKPNAAFYPITISSTASPQEQTPIESKRKFTFLEAMAM